MSSTNPPPSSPSHYETLKPVPPLPNGSPYGLNQAQPHGLYVGQYQAQGPNGHSAPQQPVMAYNTLQHSGHYAPYEPLAKQAKLDVDSSANVTGQAASMMGTDHQPSYHQVPSVSSSSLRPPVPGPGPPPHHQTPAGLPPSSSNNQQPMPHPMSHQPPPQVPPPPHHTQMQHGVPPSQAPSQIDHWDHSGGLTGAGRISSGDDGSNGADGKATKKKRKRCGECPGCLKKDNCNECGPCKSVRSHQICKMRKCDQLKTKKEKAREVSSWVSTWELLCCGFFVLLGEPGCPSPLPMAEWTVSKLSVVLPWRRTSLCVSS